MAETTGDKTEAPTPRRRREAMEQGNIARSTDLTAAVLLLSVLVLLDQYGLNLLTAMRDIVEIYLAGDHPPVRSGYDLMPLLIDILIKLGSATMPLMIGMALIAVVINIMQVGLHLNPKRLQPKAQGLNPLKGLKKIFGGGRGAMQLAFNILKLILVGGVAYSAVHGKLGQIVEIASLSLMQIFQLAGGIVYDIGIRIGVVLLILAIMDYAWQTWRHEQDLKMTKQEVKDDMKRMEGDPLIKQRRRQIQLQRAMQRVNQAVPTADVIVTNPTHFAVALKYDSDNMNAPKVVAKGADFLAHKIRQIAVENGIPIIERPPLARALYRLCDVGQEIPEQFYNAVAEILAYVWELTGKARRKVAG
jgi:flagellar biosynthesis protein FlhB